MNAVFYVAIGVVIGAGTVAGLWIHENEKEWTPPDDMAVDAWEIATGKTVDGIRATRAGASRASLIWFFAWMRALRRPRE